MILIEIAAWFFLIYGMIQFGLFLWEVTTNPRIQKGVTIFYPLSEDAGDPQQTLRELHKLNYPIIALASGGEQDRIASKVIETMDNVQLLDKKELMNQIHTLLDT